MTCPAWLGCALLAAFATACSRDESRVEAAGFKPELNRMSPLSPGPSGPAAPAEDPKPDGQILGDGERLYNQFNCSGCHAAGGGAIGPPLMDDEWIYGGSEDQIFWTILEGRPNGMPAFGGRITEDQARRLAAYVRSLSSPPEQSPAPVPPPPEANPAERGKTLFLNGPCSLCHTIRGTRALATVGPDLTHVASRESIAGVVPNTRGNMSGWILNPQNLKPGTLMPPTKWEPEDLHALVTFLETLK